MKKAILGFLCFALLSSVEGQLTPKKGFTWEKVKYLLPMWNDTNPDNPFPRRQLKSSTELKWTSNCYSGFDCARLTVPLDYNNSKGAKASIALVRKPATVSQRSGAYKGPLLVNPGGPGASGVGMVLDVGGLLSQLVQGEYDVVGFDPRGVARSTPRASFFASSAQREVYNANIELYPYNDTLKSVGELYARYQVLGSLASQADTGFLRHINTENTARDMLQIIKAAGRDKLVYWGFSYGSALGATFASLFPRNVGRLVFDGVVDPTQYFGGVWTNALQDSGKTMAAFFQGCFEAGSAGCAFWASSPEAIRANLDALYAKVLREPVPVVLPDGRHGILDHDKLRNTVAAAMYSPYLLFPYIAQGLAQLAQGDGRTLYSILAKQNFDCNCKTSDAELFAEVGEGGEAIMCNDTPRVGGLAEIVAFYNQVSGDSEWGPMLTKVRAPCGNWPQYPSSSFTAKPFKNISTQPILLVANSADPMAPISGARLVNQYFANSVLLTIDGPGHTSCGTQSSCALYHVATYLRTGQVPPKDTVCPTDTTPFPRQNAARSESVSSYPAEAKIAAELSQKSPVRSFLF